LKCGINFSHTWQMLHRIACIKLDDSPNIYNLFYFRMPDWNSIIKIHDRIMLLTPNVCRLLSCSKSFCHHSFDVTPHSLTLCSNSKINTLLIFHAKHFHQNKQHHRTIASSHLRRTTVPVPWLPRPQSLPPQFSSPSFLPPRPLPQ